MEFLDPKKQRNHTIRILVGYVFIALALILATTVLIYQARGFGVKNGQVIQNGRVFISSTPEGGDVYINGRKMKARTNTSFVIEAGQYTFEIKRDGYDTWRRAINVEGGALVRFDYPFLFPAKLTTDTLAKYDALPDTVLQSPDRRWLLLPAATFGTLNAYDLENPDDEQTPLIVPADLLTKAAGKHTWELGEWSTDNRHVLLKHLYGSNQAEYILVDRVDISKSVNLTTALGVSTAKILLRDKAHDQYYIYDEAARNVFTASLKKPNLQIYQQHVLAFKAYGEDRALYVTDQSAPVGKVLLQEREGAAIYTLHSFPAGTQYLVDMARYGNKWYVMAGAASESRTYIYKNPVASLKDKPKEALVPVHILKTKTPNYISFSDNARFLMAENGAEFTVYDAENDKGYAYQLTQPIDAPEAHANWMDGHRLTITSGGKTHVFEFDNANSRTLVAALPGYLPAFSPEYSELYTLAKQVSKNPDGSEKVQYGLTGTSLQTTEDQ